MLVARNCPDLQRLVCTVDEGVLSTVSDAMASSTVVLNSLRVLLLWTKSPHGLRFLSRLSFPASTHHMLHYNSYSHQNAFNLNCSASMHTIISGITCMSVSGARKHAIQVVSPSDIQFRVAVERYDWCALQRSPHYTPFDALEFPALEQLHIRYAGAPLVLLDGDWAKILNKLPNLTRLSIVDAGFSAYNVALALGHRPIWGGSHTGRYAPVVCPLLQSIVINIDRGKESGLLPGLARSLAWRAERGYRLQSCCVKLLRTQVCEGLQFALRMKLLFADASVNRSICHPSCIFNDKKSKLICYRPG